MDNSSETKGVKILWEYIVKDEYLDQFLQMYSPEGAWSKLFRKFKGYLGTELIRDTSHKKRFITIDHWVSHPAYSDMKHLSRKEYRSIDVQCELFTVDENYIGIFETT